MVAELEIVEQFCAVDRSGNEKLVLGITSDSYSDNDTRMVAA